MMPFPFLKPKYVFPDSQAASQLGHALYYWELNSAWMMTVTGIPEKWQNRELMKPIKLWKSGTLDHKPTTTKKPLSIRTSLGISLSLWSL